MKIKFRTKAACHITGVEPQRLNEAIAAGAYTCAPNTTPGKSRTFDEDDLLALFVWGFLINHNSYPLKMASMYACRILENARHRHIQEPARLDFPLNPFPSEMIPCQSDDPTTFHHSIGGVVTTSFATLSFNLELLRKEIQGRMEAEAIILGEED